MNSLVRPQPAWRCAAAFAVLALTACTTVGPDYQRPALSLPTGYSETTAQGADSTVPDAWWSLYRDPALTQLVETALAHNQDLVLAAARVEEARALAGLARAERFPEVTATASANRAKQSQQNPDLPSGIDLESSRFRTTASVSFELDFWGRLARTAEAARAELLASEEGQRNVRLGVTSGVAIAYFDLVSLADRLRIARETLTVRQENVRLQEVRFTAGSISELDLAQAQAELAATEATIPALERQLQLTENQLTVLLGTIGGKVAPSPAGGFVAVLPEIPVGLPSDLLARRPDVVAAELRLIAANARIGAARAQYFPHIALTGFAGSESAELSNLFASGTTVWQAVLGLVQPIFNAGKTRRQVAAARAREQQAQAIYAKTLQTAFAEVEDGLATRRTSLAERAAIERQVKALARALELAELRYEAGESSYLEVLDAQRNLFRAQLDWTRARRDEFVTSVALFKALGGGWSLPSP